MFKPLLLIIVMLVSTPIYASLNEGDVMSPTVDLSAVRYIICKDSTNNIYSGTGFLVGPHELVTAFHVAEGKWMNKPNTQPECYDVGSHTRLTAYKLDHNHDLAIMTGATLPVYLPYIKYKCNHPVPGINYDSYGITDYNTEEAILRENTMQASAQFTGSSLDDEISGIPSPGMRYYHELADPESMAPGMSGGPVIDHVDGAAVAINDAGEPGTAVLYDLADGALCTGKWD